MNLSDVLSVVIILGIIPLAIIVTIVFFSQIKHKERMAMIEKGLETSLPDKKESPFQDVLMWGLLSVGIGLGLFIGYLLLATALFKDDMILGIMSILFGGIGLIIYYVYKNRTKNKESR